MNKTETTFAKGLLRILLSALAIVAIGSVFAQTEHSNRISTSSASREKVPAFAVTTAQAPDEPNSKDDDLVKLLREENKRLKIKIERLEKENAELKAKLAGKQ